MSSVVLHPCSCRPAVPKLWTTTTVSLLRKAAVCPSNMRKCSSVISALFTFSEMLCYMVLIHLTHFIDTVAATRQSKFKSCCLFDLLSKQHKHWSDWFVSAVCCWLNKPESPQQRTLCDSGPCIRYNISTKMSVVFLPTPQRQIGVRPYANATAFIYSNWHSF